MKRIILILAILAILPIFMFAQKTGELGIGGALYFKSPVLLGQSEMSAVYLKNFS